jgi:hypothetical protein
MAQQTAVEWYTEQLRKLAFDTNHHLGLGDIRLTQWQIDELNEQAKAMEKEQIMKSFSDGQETPISNPTLPHYSREEYYNEVYKSGQS